MNSDLPDSDKIMKKSDESKTTLGWREWLALPDLGIPAVKAKVDTGARTSTLHAFFVEPFEEDGRPKVRFYLHPLQKRQDVELACVADIIDRRLVSDSGGHRELRYIIKTPIKLGGNTVEAEITLTDRDAMRFRMLLGRTALAGRFVVDPALSYLAGPKPVKPYGVGRKRRQK